MKKITYTLQDPFGIHARPAGLLVRQAAAFVSNISISLDGKTADAKKIFDIMSLGAKCGDTITIWAEGTDEVQAATIMEEFLKSKF